jgi:hypothetical protein
MVITGFTNSTDEAEDPFLEAEKYILLILFF